MNITQHPIGDTTAIEINSNDILIHSEQDALDLMATAIYTHHSQKIILHQKNIAPGFFDLTSGLAGAILQKFSNYGIQLALVGDFDQYSSSSLKEFIRESNSGSHVSFVATLGAAIQKLL